MVGDGALGRAYPKCDLGGTDLISWSIPALGWGSSTLALIPPPTASLAGSLNPTVFLNGLCMGCFSSLEGSSHLSAEGVGDFLWWPDWVSGRGGGGSICPSCLLSLKVSLAAVSSGWNPRAGQGATPVSPHAVLSFLCPNGDFTQKFHICPP